MAEILSPWLPIVHFDENAQPAFEAAEYALGIIIPVLTENQPIVQYYWEIACNGGARGRFGHNGTLSVKTTNNMDENNRINYHMTLSNNDPMPDLRVKILVFQQDGTVISQYLLGEGEHTVGRDPNSAIYCESAHISNDHAKLHISDEGIFIEDLNSTSGTFLDQINVRGKVRLTPGQRLQVGDLHIDLQLEGVGDLSPGVKIGAGRYQLNKELGRGAMGQVWLAQDTQLEEYVAIKVLPSDVANDAVCLLDLKREVQKSRKLSHDNIIRIHDLIQLPGENPFVTLEFVQGTDLHAIQMNQSDRIFGWEEVKPYVLQLCDALDYAHERKIVHRDLKPSNIMITNDGVLKLADFGIAASIADSTGRSSIADIISGTPQFMSPQQMLGESPRASDDIYALGATMYCLLTGRPPFHTGDIAQQAQHITPAPL